MKNHCAFSKNHSCPLWTDYELTCYELEEANSLCHGNWIEIERQYKYIQTLQKILSENDIPYPNEYDFWIIIQEGLELFQTLKLATQVCPSNQPLTTDPQLVRQTLKNFDYPI